MLDQLSNEFLNILSSRMSRNMNITKHIHANSLKRRSISTLLAMFGSAGMTRFENHGIIMHELERIILAHHSAQHRNFFLPVLSTNNQIISGPCFSISRNFFHVAPKANNFSMFSKINNTHLFEANIAIFHHLCVLK